MFLKQQNLLLFLFLCILFAITKCQVPVFVYPIDNNITQYCSKNVYYFEFQVKFSQRLDKIIPFEMTIPLPNRLPFKCVIDGPNTKILCFHSFANYVWSLSDNSRIELPYSFPFIDGIRWDYDSFLTKIYRYLWRTQGNCGLELEDLEDLEDLDEDESKKFMMENAIHLNMIIALI